MSQHFRRKPLVTSSWTIPGFYQKWSSAALFAPKSHFSTAQNIAAKSSTSYRHFFPLFCFNQNASNLQKAGQGTTDSTDSWMISSYLQLFFNCKEVSEYTAEHLLISTTALFLLLTLPTPPPLHSLTTIPKALANCKLSVTCGVGFILCILMHFLLKVP